MQLIVFIGIQGSGKSSFYSSRFRDSHLRINMDMLRTRHREQILFDACLRSKTPVVIDNTNPTIDDRARYISPARTAKYEIVGYFFQSILADCLDRNSARDAEQRVPEQGVQATSNKLQMPSRTEGFDELYFVKMLPGIGQFEVSEWVDEI